MDSKRYLIILTDRVKARFFTIYLDDFEDEKWLKEENIPQKTKNVGRPGKTERHVKDHLYKHLKKSANEALEFAKLKRIDAVIVGGHKELLNQIKQFLPSKLKNKLKGEFVTDINIPLSELTKKAKAAI